MSEFVLPTFEECRAAYVDRQDASALQCFIFLHSPILHKPEFATAWREMLGDVIDEVLYDATKTEGIQIREDNHYA